MKEYNHKQIEGKWQKIWEKEQTYFTEEDSAKPKSFVLDMFPYPSGEGLHVGHVRVYTASDVYSRLKRMNGYRVLHPTGWDAFGLPAEQFAIKNKIHPRVAVSKNVETFKRQMNLLGLSYDWNREIDTTNPDFYRWTQWIFLKLLEKGLAYESYEPINWCPSCQTGLANEDLEGNACERCGTVVEKKPMRQWVLKITDYADRLIKDLDLLSEWPTAFRESQRNWIGKSEGAEIEFNLQPTTYNLQPIKVFTTRPDTLFGATYMVLAPDHEFVTNNLQQITNKEEVEKYIKEVSKKTEIERTAEGKEKTGVELKGIKAINPANKEELPVFIADYVLKDYGTGAIMAVPAHDERDYEFAKKFGVPIRQVIVKNNGIVKSYLMGAEKITDQDLLGLDIKIVEKTKDGDRKIIIPSENLSKYEKLITGKITAGFWNEYISDEIVFIFKHKDDKIERVVLSVENEEYVDKLAAQFCGEDWKKSGVWKWLADNSFYTDVIIHTEHGKLVNSGKFDGLDSEEAKAKITEFVGGQMKTAYKLRDWVFSRQRYWGEPIPVVHCEKDGVVPVPEAELPVLLPEVKSYEPTGTGESPLAEIEDWVNTKCPKCGGPAKRETNTMPQWAGSSWYYLRFIDPKNNKALVDQKKEKEWMPVDVYVGGAEHATRHLIYARFWHKFLKDINIVSTNEPFTRLESVGLILGEGGVKMSKRLGNVVNPDNIVEIYGADTLRLYEMFIGPFSQASSWDMKSIIGPRRFLEKVWRLAGKIGDQELSEKSSILLNQTIKKVGEDIEGFKFNTAISQMMILLSAFEMEKTISKESFESLLKMLSLFAPHITEELWQELGHEKSIHAETWPTYDESKLAGDTCTIVIQINGKVRGSFTVPSRSDEETVKKIALEHKSAQKWLEGKELKKVVYVSGKLVSIVI